MKVEIFAPLIGAVIGICLIVMIIPKLNDKQEPIIETTDKSIEQVYHVEYYLTNHVIIKANSAVLYPTKIHLHHATLINNNDKTKLNGETVIIDKTTWNIQFPDGMIIEETR